MRELLRAVRREFVRELDADEANRLWLYGEYGLTSKADRCLGRDVEHGGPDVTSGRFHYPLGLVRGLDCGHEWVVGRPKHDDERLVTNDDIRLRRYDNQSGDSQQRATLGAALECKCGADKEMVRCQAGLDAEDALLRHLSHPRRGRPPAAQPTRDKLAEFEKYVEDEWRKQTPPDRVLESACAEMGVDRRTVELWAKDQLTDLREISDRARERTKIWKP